MGCKPQIINNMAQSLCKMYIHLIFHIKTTSPQIRVNDLESVFSYLGNMVNTTGCSVMRVGGIGNHVHILFLLAKEVCVPHVVEKVKCSSSKWIKTIDPYYSNFAWQGGYGAFSVSQSVIDRTIKYIENQRAHHENQTYNEEYLKYLQSYDIKYDERYVFTD